MTTHRDRGLGALRLRLDYVIDGNGSAYEDTDDEGNEPNKTHHESRRGEDEWSVFREFNPQKRRCRPQR